jgi:hypothetical protein
MSIEKGLFQLIQTDPTTSSLVNMAKGNGVYWVLAPKAVGSKTLDLPYIVLDRVATSDTITMQGDIGFRNALFQVSCYASDYYTSRTVAQAIRNLLKSYKGNLPDVSSTAVAGVLQTKDWDFQYEEGGVGFIWRAMLEFRIWYYDSSLPVTPTSNGPAVIDGGQS